LFSSSSPKALCCPERKLLSDLFIAAVRDIMALQDAELQAARDGTSRERLDVALGAARSKRDRIKREFLHHVEAHGCDAEPGVENL
jgi:hypothetical protein